jgi:hypothetical protein
MSKHGTNKPKTNPIEKLENKHTHTHTHMHLTSVVNIEKPRSMDDR